MIAKGYKLPHEFPHESFIQEVLEDFFESEGYSIIEEKPIDIKCSNADKNETWIIEVKGKTSQIGLDFKTCLGQIVMRMNNPDYIYYFLKGRGIKFSRPFLLLLKLLTAYKLN